MQIPSTSAAAVYGERTVEQLSYQSVQFELSLKDNRGRSVDLSFNSEQLSYSKTYDQFGAIGLSGKLDQSANPAEQARAFSLGAYDEQAAFFKHEAIQVDYSSMNLQIDGDASLLQDYFASDVTAQRIFDFATGLNPGLAAGTDAFANFAQDIRDGIQAGFEQAESILGPLPDISHETQSLLDMMLAQFTDDPSQVQSAQSLLADMRAQEEETA